jgi:hypothetical protein
LTVSIVLIKKEGIGSAKKGKGGNASEEKKHPHKIHAPVTATPYVPSSSGTPGTAV